MRDGSKRDAFHGARKSDVFGSAASSGAEAAGTGLGSTGLGGTAGGGTGLHRGVIATRKVFRQYDRYFVIRGALMIALIAAILVPGQSSLSSDDAQVEVLGSTQLKHTTPAVPESLPFQPTENLFEKITPGEAPRLGQPAAPTENKVNQGATVFSQSPVDEPLAGDIASTEPNTVDRCDRIDCTIERVPNQLDTPEPGVCDTQVVVFANRWLDTGIMTEPVDVALTCERYEISLTSTDAGHALGVDVDQTQETWFVEGLDAAGNVVYASPLMIELEEADTALTATIHAADLRHVAQLRAVHGAAEGSHPLTVTAVVIPVAIAETSCTSAVAADMVADAGAGWIADFDLAASGCAPEGAVMTGWAIGVADSSQRFHHDTLDRVSFTAETLDSSEMVLFPIVEVDGQELPHGSIVAPTALGS